MEYSDRYLARDLLRRYDLNAAASVATSAINNASNPWPYRLILLDVRRLQGQRVEALQELGRLADLDPPAPEDAESNIAIKKLRGYYTGLLGRCKASHHLLQEAEKLACDSNLIEPLAEVHQCQAMIYFLQQNYLESNRLFRLVLDLSRQIGGWYFRGSGLWGIGKNLMIQRFYEEAMPWLYESLAVFEEADVELSKALVWGELAVCELGLGRDQQSLELLRKAEAVQENAGTVANYQIVLGNIGNVYLYRKEYPTAISYYRHALTIAREIQDPVSIHKWTYNTNLALMRMRSSIDETGQKGS
jgi:tetratricopeptide (TPR) repeat protein